MVAALLFVAATTSAAKRAHLAPQLRAGQSFDYLVSVQTSRSVRTESRVVVPNIPAGEKLEAFVRLHVEVLSRDAAGARLRVTFERFPLQPASPAGSAKSSGKALSPQDTPPSIEFTLQAPGVASQLAGFDNLAREQQAAWQEWLSRFAAGMIFPKTGINRGDKWETQEREAESSPIAELMWMKKFEYVRDEPCPLARGTSVNDFVDSVKSGESCAVILTSAILKQKSSPKDATPEDYKIRNLRTKGTATGKNETILYISHSTGLLMRASETADQAMDATISLADGGNQVHYTISAESHSRVLFLNYSSAHVRAHP